MTLQLKFEIKNKDELADMAAVFNLMLSSFRKLIIEVNQSIVTLNSATHNLSKNVSISHAGVDSQLRETDMVAAAVTEMVATIDNIASNTNDAAAMAESTNLNAKKGSS